MYSDKTIIPKMTRWHRGAGLMGKQGAEAVHVLINKLEGS